MTLAPEYPSVTCSHNKTPGSVKVNSGLLFAKICHVAYISATETFLKEGPLMIMLARKCTNGRSGLRDLM